MHLKKLLILFFLLLIPQVGYCKHNSAAWEIKAENNAYRHNNKGLMYLEDKYYFGAIKEFQMAIDLLPNTQATATFYTNLGRTYEKIGYPDLAKNCYEKAVSINVLCFDYYLQLAKCYKTLGLLDKKLEEFQNKKTSPLNNIMIGLLYIQKGQTTTGITILDDFCDQEKNLLITAGVKNYLKKITAK